MAHLLHSGLNVQFSGLDMLTPIHALRMPLPFSKNWEYGHY